MALPLYLAMTQREIAAASLPGRVAYMACHFDAYGKGLADIPQQLPPESLLILDDRIPVWEHDPGLVTDQLCRAVTALECNCVLLDFQRPGEPLIKDITRSIADALPCPVAVTEAYAEAAGCAVLVSAPPPNQGLSRQAEAWQGRELWLEAAQEVLRYTVTEGGSCREWVTEHPEAFPQHDDRLCCSYHVEVLADRAIFTVGRTWEDLQLLMVQGEEMGFTRAVGLYQQLGKFVLG